jgi:surfeit locus 1 family protein
VAVIGAVVCVRLGFWQLDRLEHRRAANAAIEAGLAAAPGEATDLLRDDPATLAYRPAIATGTYDPSGELVLYGRSLDGRPGDHVLTPLVLDDGTRLLVDRGWIPFAPARTVPLTGVAAAPSGPVRVTGVLRASESGDAFGDQAPADADVVRAVNLDELRARDPGLAPAYLQLTAQDPAQPEPIPAPIEPLGDGPHLSYAIQWFAFATIAVVGVSFLLVRGRRDSGGG